MHSIHTNIHTCIFPVYINYKLSIFISEGPFWRVKWEVMAATKSLLQPLVPISVRFLLYGKAVQIIQWGALLMGKMFSCIYSLTLWNSHAEVLTACWMISRNGFRKMFYSEAKGLVELFAIPTYCDWTRKIWDDNLLNLCATQLSVILGSSPLCMIFWPAMHVIVVGTVPS